MTAPGPSVTNRPGENYSYTNNFPYDPALVYADTRRPVVECAKPYRAAGWLLQRYCCCSASSIILVGLAAGQHVHPHLLPGQPAPASWPW